MRFLSRIIRRLSLGLCIIIHTRRDREHALRTDTSIIVPGPVYRSGSLFTIELYKLKKHKWTYTYIFAEFKIRVNVAYGQQDCIRLQTRKTRSERDVPVNGDTGGRNNKQNPYDM